MSDSPGSRTHFQTTRWSLIARTAEGDREAAHRAVGELCEIYWYPLYAFLRRRGSSEADALDLVQAFCLQLLERGGLGGAERTMGSFRNYLIGALRHFVDNQRRHDRAGKRGGGLLPWSLHDAEGRYAVEPPDAESPERVFERQFALALLERATTRLRSEYRARGREALLSALEPALLGDDGALPHQQIAEDLGTSEGAIKVALHRMRRCMQELIRDEVLQTVADPTQVEGELQHLFAALSG